MKKTEKIYIAGHRGMVGSAILRNLKEKGYDNFVLKSSDELDLRNQKATKDFFEIEKPEYVFLAAAKVGGIAANIANPVNFLYDNLMIESNVIKAAFDNKVKKLIFLGSSCIYPRLSQQPMKEEYLLNGPFEPTNEGYALAKVAGLKLCQYYKRQYNANFITVIPPNLYGPRDNFDPKTSHVIAALIRKFYMAKENNDEQVEIWGTGKARREFMYVADVADAIVFLFENDFDIDIINTGINEDISIEELGELVSKILEFKGDIIFDSTNADGMPRKLMDSSKLQKYGWFPKEDLESGIRKTYSWFRTNIGG